MKRFTKIMSVLMVAIMLVCCFAIVASAKNNTAEYQKSVICVAATQQYTAANDPTIVLTRSGMGTGFGVGIPGEKIQYIATAAHVVYEPSGVYAVIDGPGYYDIVPMEEGTKYPDRYPTTINGIDCDVYVDYFMIEAVQMYAIYSNSTGDYVDLTLAQVNNDVDLAICKLASDPTDKISALPLQFKEDVEVGDDIIAIGYPSTSEVFNEEKRFDATDSTVYDGKISKKQSTKGMNGSKTVFDTYEVSANLVTGMSGGPVINEETGAVVGVTSFKYIDYTQNSTANMAICIDNLKPLLDNLGINYESTGDSNLLLFIIIGVGALILILIIVIIIILTKKNNNTPMNNVPVIPMAPPAGPVGGAPVSSAHLLGISGPFAGRKFGIQERAIIGRDKAKCNVVFPIDQPGVSGLHCEVKVSGGVITLKDFGSSYGTFLSNGTKIAPNTPVVLQNGARFWVGTSENVFEVRI